MTTPTGTRTPLVTALMVQVAARLAPAVSPATAMPIGPLLRAVHKLMPSTPLLLSTMDLRTYCSGQHNHSAKSARTERADCGSQATAQILNPCAPFSLH